jgi:hypothetical protein
MTIHFFNQDIPNAKFGIRWGQNNSTPTITLNPGDMASFDLDVFNKIPPGESCQVFSSQNGTDLYKQSVKKFKYIQGRYFGGTFKFCMRGINKLALTYYRLM